MSGYVVTDEEGRVVKPGDTVTSFRGENAEFVRVARGASLGHSALVEVFWKGTEVSVPTTHTYYAQVFGLSVEPEPLP